MKVAASELLFFVLTLLSYLLIFLVPFAIGRKSRNYFSLLFRVLFVTFILFFISTYWSEELSVQLMYYLYGFNEYGMNDTERFQNVSPENRMVMDALFKQTTGIGWQLKFAFRYVMILVPYNLIACAIAYKFRSKQQL